VPGRSPERWFAQTPAWRHDGDAIIQSGRGAGPCETAATIGAARQVPMPGTMRRKRAVD
jgi:hypothetical protein